MSNNNARLPQAQADFSVLEATAEWYSILHADAVSEEDRRGWNAWLQADLSHRQAWQRVTEISQKFEQLPDALHPRAGNSALLAVVDKPRRRSLKLLGMVGGVGLIAALTARTTPVRAWLAEYRTGVGQQRRLQLADGTELWLNTSTAVDVDYDDRTRTVHLRSGEIQIQTAHDKHSPARPFIVETKQGQLRPLGTNFTVQADNSYTHLAVFEGAVEIRLSDDSAQTRQVVPAGRQIHFMRDRLEAMGDAELMRQAWTRGVLIADNMRLDDFIKELNRYHHGILMCDPAVADLRIVGAFPVNDTEKILLALEETLPIAIREHTHWWISVGKKTS